MSDSLERALSAADEALVMCRKLLAEKRDVCAERDALARQLAERDETIQRLENNMAHITEQRNGCLQKLEEHADNLADARVALRAVWASWTQGADLNAAVALVKASLLPPAPERGDG